jgi:hypothetical protein
MSTERDVNRIVRSWLNEDRHEDADRVLNTVLDQLDTTPQRRTLWSAWRFPIMNNALRFGLAAAAVVVIAIIAIQFLPGSNVGGPPTETSPASTPAPSAAGGPTELPLTDGTGLTAGTYFLADFPVRITVDVPDGWVSCSEGHDPLDQGVCYSRTPSAPGVGVGFLIVDNVTSDPCGSSQQLQDPPVGPSVDDLVTAISGLEGFEATAPIDITVDGFSGKEFTLTAPEDPGCNLFTWATAIRTNGVGAGEVNLLRIFDVDGQRIMISGAHNPDTPEEDVALIPQVMDTVHIEP